MSREINESAPKTHKRLMGKYCKERCIREYHAGERAKYEAQIAECDLEEQKYRETGEISPKFANTLFEFYRSMISLACSLSNSRYDLNENSLKQYEKELIEKGYNLDDVYAEYKKDYFVFDV